MDRTTKILLAAIALGLWANAGVSALSAEQLAEGAGGSRASRAYLPGLFAPANLRRQLGAPAS